MLYYLINPNVFVLHIVDIYLFIIQFIYSIFYLTTMYYTNSIVNKQLHKNPLKQVVFFKKITPKPNNRSCAPI